MSKRTVLCGVICVLVTSAVVVAAEPIQLDMKALKWKAAFEGGDQLGGYNDGENKFCMYVNGTATGEVAIPEEGDYTVAIEASCDEAKKMYAAFKLTIGDVVVAKDHSLTTQNAKVYFFTAKLKKGKQNLVIEFINDEFKEGEYDRNLYLHAVKLEKK
jgi:hypothetical protein